MRVVISIAAFAWGVWNLYEMSKNFFKIKQSKLDKVLFGMAVVAHALLFITIFEYWLIVGGIL